MSPAPSALFHENRRTSSGAISGFRRATAALAAFALTGAGLVLAPSASAVPVVPVTGHEAVSMVNTFIGSQEDGNTFPGATVPFGMVQLSPDNGHNVGYDYGNNAVRGFSQVHVSGVGCGIAGFVPVTPATDPITNETDYAQNNYSRSVKKVSGVKVESARPGYYTTTLTSGTGNEIKAELTATERTGLQRYTFSTGASVTNSYVRINAGQALSRVRSSKVTIDEATRTVRTETVAYRFCQDTPDFTVYSTTKFNQAFEGFGTWTNNTLTANSTSAASTQRTGAQLTFAKDATVEFQTGISYVNAAGADANLAAEASTFDDANQAATDTWAAQLGKVAVTQGITNAPTEAERTTQLRVFYSALYRSFVAPNVGSDVDGKYRGWDRQIHDATTDVGVGSKYYQYFSLWDTYRTQQQWLYLTEPVRSVDQVRSLVLQGEQSGWLPRWGYGPVETNVMTGDPGTPFLVSAWDQGLLKGEWAERAYAVLKHNADNTPAPEAFENGRAGNPVYLEDGYVPFDPTAKTRDTDYDLDHGGSATLEYALADATLSKMAATLGHTEDAARYAQRGQNYRSIWDDENQTFRSRTANGLYVTETRPEEIDGFHEGTAAQYEWLVQQDVPGLIGLMGGTQGTIDRLDEFFAYDSIDLATRPGTVARNQIPGTASGDKKGWVDGTYAYYGWKTYNPNNEPDLHAPYIYQWVGQPYKTTDVVREALTLFEDAPNGVTGNDDLGTMAAWQVLSTIGIFPIMPGNDIWGLTTPVFDQVDITLDPTFFSNDNLTIKASGDVSMTNRYTQSVTVGTATENKSFITGPELTGAGTLDFTVGATPSAWGTTDSPGTLLDSTPDITTHVTGGVRGGQTVVARNGSNTEDLALMVRGLSTVTGTASVSAPAGITAEFTGGNSWSASPNGGTKEATVGATISVGNIGAGTYPITWKFTTAAGTNTVTSNVVVPELAPSKLVASFNNKAIGDNGVADSAKFNHTEGGSGEFFLRDRMAAAGLSPNQRHALKTDPTLGYILTDKGTGLANMDNVLAQGQTIDVEGDYLGATKIAFVGSTNNGKAATGALTLNFTDGSTQVISDYGFTDWCSAEAQTTGNVIEGKVSGRWGGSSFQNLGCSLWSTKVYQLDAGKSLKSITLPNTPKHHLFAIATDSSVSATGELTLDGSLVYEAPGRVVTASVPSFSTASATAEIYQTAQWLLDGVPVTDVTGTSFELEASDIGKTLQYEVTAVSDGLNPLKLTTAPTIIKGTFTNVIAPEIAGIAQAGKTLTATPGTYSTSDVTATYQWLAGDVAIPGATSSTLAVTTAQVGKKISVRVTASRDAYVSVVTTSSATPVVIAAPVVTPPSLSVTKKPVVKGTAQVGKTVTASGATFSPSGATVSYQWLRNGKPIVGATKAKYKVTAKDYKKKLSVRVTAKKAGLLSTVATSAASKKVKAGTFKITKKVSIKGTAKVGKKLKANKPKFSVSGVKVKYQWLRNGKAIKGATKSKYKVTKKDRRKKISVKITAKKSAYSTVKSTSKRTAKVR